jgi:hypothetical protein
MSFIVLYKINSTSQTYYSVLDDVSETEAKRYGEDNFGRFFVCVAPVLP